MTTAAKKMMENWTRAEQEALIDEYIKHGHSLSMKLCNKDRLWEEILDK